VANVTFSAQPLVRVTILGEEDKSPEAKLSRLPVCRNDDGVIDRFFAFERVNNIFPIRIGASGCGAYIGYYDTLDAAKIEAWLLEQRVSRGN
jgi:hypothetical protein